jgi:heat shock protein HtpX
VSFGAERLKGESGLNIHKQISSNKRKSYIIMALFVVFIATFAYIFGQGSGYGLGFAGFALILSGLMSLGSYYWSDKIVLAISKAHPADKKQDFDFYTTAQNMAIAAGLPMPKLYVIEDSAVNAFATGRDPKHAVIVATRGLLEKLDRSDIEGVVAHEISHIKNFDIRLMGIVAVLVGTVALLADFFMRSLWWGGGRTRDEKRGNGIFAVIGIIFAIIAPIAATLIQLAISRRREFLADASAINLTRNPEGLADALEKIAADPAILRSASSATAHFYIANPFKGKNLKSKFTNLFNTHPPIEERIKILRGMR